VAFEGSDMGLIGPSYQAPVTLQDAEMAVNWYLEFAEVDGAKEPVAMLGTPGLNTVLTTSVGSVRGSWVLPGAQEALAIVGNVCYLVTISVPGTATTEAVLAGIQVGTLLTNHGPVSMRDNGVIDNNEGGFVLIVDGIYAYYYRISGAGTITFPAGVSSGSTVISLPSVIPFGLVIGTATTLSDTSGYIPAGSLLSSVDYNTPALAMSIAATGNNAADTLTLTIPAFGQILDPGLVQMSNLAFIEGWLIGNQVGTRNFVTTGPVPYTLLFPPSFFSLKDSSTDNLITLEENNRELWLVGERTSEVWYNSGLAAFSFSRIPGVGPQIGCGAAASIARLGPSLVWLARNEQGENFVAATNQYGWDRISNHAIDTAITSYPVTTDAIGYSYEEAGHLFYVLTFPTADVTWVYDATVSVALKKPTWHQRLSWDPVAGQYHRHLGNCYMNFAGMRIVGDFQNGNLYQMSREYFTDAGAPLRALRRSKHVWQKANRQRIFFAQLQIEFTPGVGLQVGQGSNPQCMLRWSDDGGFTWNDEVWAPIGMAGETKNRAIWYLLGEARDRVWEASFTDPVARDIIGATCYMEAAS
jgi:hypothetical protein